MLLLYSYCRLLLIDFLAKVYELHEKSVLTFKGN